MCERAVLEDLGMLDIVPDQYRNPEICERTVKWFLWTLKFVPGQYKTQEMCNNAMEAWQPSRYWHWCWPVDEKKLYKSCATMNKEKARKAFMQLGECQIVVLAVRYVHSKCFSI